MTTDGEMQAIDEVFELGLELAAIAAHTKTLRD
jgi:hypothetical protein